MKISHITKVNAYKAFFFSLFLIISFTLKSFGQTFTDSTPAGTETWTVPANVYSLTVQCWGGGGSGGGDDQNGGVGGAGGGAGGSYASSTIAVTPGQTFNYSVGTGGTGSIANGEAGSPTWFDTVTTVYAQGGAPGQSANGGSPNRAGGAGSTAASFGTTLINGGNGNNGTTTVGAAGGAGGNGGGAGGAQRTTDGNGNNGVAPGGGGGGAFTGGNTDRSGGNGANGRLRITYTVTIPGNTPCNAISISNDGCTTQDNTGATDSGVTVPSGCSTTIGYSGNDIWFVTTADANGALEIETNHLSGSLHDDTVVAFYTGTCGSLTLIDCDDDSGDGIFEAYQVLSGLIPNETIYIREWNYNSTSSEGEFEICLSTSTAPTPPNDECSNATALNCGDNDIAGTTSGASNLNPGVGCPMSTYGVWYTFVGDGDLSQITVVPESGFDVEMSISSGSCAGLTNIACRDFSGSGGSESYSWVTTSGVTYYIYIADPYNGSGPFDVGDFTISRNCQTVSPPPNDDCIGAIDLVVNGSCVNTAATTLYATPSSGVGNPNCSGYSGGDVWFTVTVPPSLGNQMTIATQSGIVTNSGMAVYSGTCGGTLTEIACENDSGMTSINLSYLDGISTGDILYIRVWETGNDNNGSFSICVTAPVSGTNDVEICLGEASQPLSTDLFCNTGATSPHPLSGSITSSSPLADRLHTLIDSTDPCQFDSGISRRYDIINFTVSATGTYVFTSSGSFDTMGYIVVNDGNFNPGSCGSGTYIAGDDDGAGYPLSEITANLTQGVNYSLITTHWGTSYGSYSWTVGLTPTSAEWYTNEIPAPGDTPIAYGAFFDPVTAGYIADTNTAGTTTFYVACDGTSSRTPVDFVINSGPSSITISGAEVDCNNYEITVTVDELGNNGDGWYIEYTYGGNTYWIDDGSGVLLPANNPYTFTLSDIQAPAGTAIAISYAVSNTAPYCETSNFIGSVSTSYNCSCVEWDAGGSDDNWNTAANWSTNMVPTLSDCVIIRATGGSDPIVTTTNAQCLSLTIDPGAGVTVQSVGAITVDEEVNNSGYFTIQGNEQDTGQLIQIDATAINSGSITVVRETNVRTQDYVYWSSPVENFSITNIGNTSNRYEWIPTIPTNLPGTFGNWQYTSENMLAGKGYIVRAPFSNEPANNPDTATWNTQNFVGIPHNGTIIKTINRGNNNTDYSQGPGPDDDIEAEDDNWNLVGNPYPSALDCDAFINHSSNSDINGTLYLWTHGTKLQQGYGSPFYGNYLYNYNIDDYLEYNLSGSNPPGFNGYIGSGQGFFVQMLHTATTPSSVTFDNTMRNQSNDNSQFFRLSQPYNNNSNIERHRIWLDLVEPSEKTTTTLIAYLEGATMGKDRLFDGMTIGGNAKNIYSLINDEEYSIQGRSLPFDINDEVPIGITVNGTGIFAFAINQLDGLFEETTQEIFIEDIESGTIHNIKESPYFFTVDESGTYNNRFLLRYTNTTLGLDDISKNEIHIIAPNNEYIKVTSGTNQIESIKVFDLLGRVLIDKQNVNTSEMTINNIPKATGAYIVKTILVNGIQKIQKVALK